MILSDEFFSNNANLKCLFCICIIKGYAAGNQGSDRSEWPAPDHRFNNE